MLYFLLYPTRVCDNRPTSKSFPDKYNQLSSIVPRYDYSALYLKKVYFFRFFHPPGATCANASSIVTSREWRRRKHRECSSINYVLASARFCF